MEKSVIGPPLKINRFKFVGTIFCIAIKLPEVIFKKYFIFTQN